MKKRKTAALLLVLVVLLSSLPVIGFATKEGEAAAAFEGLPADQSWGVLFNISNYVLGYDLSGGAAALCPALISPDGRTINSLPNGAAIIRFIKADADSYYFTVGGKYLTVKDLDKNNKQKLVYTDSAEPGSGWIFQADQAGRTGYYNIRNAAYVRDGKPVYLELFGGAVRAWGYSKTGSDGQDRTASYQFKPFATSEDEDGRVGAQTAAAPLPVDGGKYVIYNHYGRSVMGQPTGADADAPALRAAAAKRNSTGALDYEDTADGALIFTAHVLTAGSKTCYCFENNGRYLAMSENFINEQGKLDNPETLQLIDLPEDEDKRGYVRWTLKPLENGYELDNVKASRGGKTCCVRFFEKVFSGWTCQAELSDCFAMNFFPMADKDGQGYVVNPQIVFQQIEPAEDTDCTVRFTLEDAGELASIKVRYYTSRTENGNQRDSETQTAEITLHQKQGSFVVPAAELSGWSSLTVLADAANTVPKQYSAACTFEIRNEPLILSAIPEPQSATGAERRPEIAVTYANLGEGATFEMLVDGKAVAASAAGGRLSFKPAADLKQGKHTVSVTLTRSDGKQTAQTWFFFVGAHSEALYFGQIHAHTAEYSDGAGTLADAYAHAQAVDDMDFLIVTDHSNYFDTKSAATASSYYDLSSLKQNGENTETRWEQARATARAYNELYEDFLCVYGYEMTWSGGPGHINSFNTYGVISRNCGELNDKNDYAGMHRYNDLLVNADRGLDVTGAEAKTIRNGVPVSGVNATKYLPFDSSGEQVPVVSQFNHPGKTFGNFDNYAGYHARRDSVLNLIEVGNGEGKVGGSSYYPSYEEYDRCLSMGWHVAPTNNQDNHRGSWGDANSCRVVILTDDFSESGLYRALDQRRVYATEDQNLRIFYELTSHGRLYKLGDIVPIDDEGRPETVTVRLEITDPDPDDRISAIEVIGEGGRTLKTVSVNGVSFKGELVLENTDGFYYIRVRETDGQIAVTAPIWVQDEAPVCTDLQTSAAVAVQGEEETVTATLTNVSETETLILNGYKLEAEDRILAEQSDLAVSVAPCDDQVLTLPFLPSRTDPPAKNSYEIRVTFYVTRKGKAMTLTKSLAETSYPAEQLTYVGLDRGHKNLYVSGSYAGSEAAFVQICTQHGIICEYLNPGDMTREKLSKYKAILLTVPFVNEQTQPPVWTEKELDAIAAYAANGGSILNFSKSDRFDYAELADGKDTLRYSSAALSNAVNEAVGAQTRFVRGIVVDNDKKTNEAFRINFSGSELVGDHVFTQGISAASNGAYQWYNGTGITVDPCLRFSDVNRSSWYHTAVDFVTEHGLMSGTSATSFSPTVRLTREMLVTILWAMEEKPEPSVSNPFSDVSPGRFSYKPILWAYENSITSGTSATTFSPYEGVSREQIAAFLYSYARYRGLDLSARADLSGFPDADRLSGWAVTPMKWAVANGMISGVSNGGRVHLNPERIATRAEIAVILKGLARFCGDELPKSPGAVTTLIAPYPTSWISSYKTCFTGSSYVPDEQTDAVMPKQSAFSLVTAEPLSGGGFLVCAGACFISSFDLKSGVAADEQYENYALVCNILDFLIRE